MVVVGVAMATVIGAMLMLAGNAGKHHSRRESPCSLNQNHAKAALRKNGWQKGR